MDFIGSFIRLEFHLDILLKMFNWKTTNNFQYEVHPNQNIALVFWCDMY